MHAADMLELEQLQAERMRRDGAADPLVFARLLGFEPDGWQAKVLRWPGGRLCLNCSRQSGKSTVSAILALHRAIYKARSLVLLISPSLRQSGELLRKVHSFLGELPKSVAPKLAENNKLSIELGNGSRIVSLPSSEDTIRGFSAVDLIVEDEAGDVDDELNVAVRPMLAVSRGSMVLMGTPKGRRGHFYEAWERGRWEKIKVTAAECGRIDPEWLAEERADLTARGLGELYRQEYEGAFIDAASGRVYGGFDEQRCALDALPTVTPGAPWTYILGLDFGIVDQNACSVLAWRKHDACVYVVEAYRITGDAVTMAEEVQRLEAQYHFAKIVGDVGGLGKGFAEQMRSRHSIPVQAAEKHNKLGYVSLLNGDLRTGKLKVVRGGCAQLVDEWLSLAWAEGGQKEAEGDNHAADATLYAWRACNAMHEKPAKLPPQTLAERLEALRKAEEKRWAEVERMGDEHALQQAASEGY